MLHTDVSAVEAVFYCFSFFIVLSIYGGTRIIFELKKKQKTPAQHTTPFSVRFVTLPIPTSDDKEVNVT